MVSSMAFRFEFDAANRLLGMRFEATGQTFPGAGTASFPEGITGKPCKVASFFIHASPQKPTLSPGQAVLK